MYMWANLKESELSNVVGGVEFQDGNVDLPSAGVLDAHRLNIDALHANQNAYIDVAGELRCRAVIPVGTQSLGNSSTRWATVYATQLDVAGNLFAHDNVNNDMFMAGFVCNTVSRRIECGDIMPRASGHDIGSSGSRWQSLYGESLRLHKSGDNISYITGSDLGGIHFGDTAGDISGGGGKVEWSASNSRMYIRGRNNAGADTDGVYLHLSGFVRWHTTVHQWPSQHQALDLGASSLQYRDVYCVSVTESSDPRMKSDISDLDDRSIAFINGLRPRTYKYINGDSGRFHTGFLSTEVKDALDNCGLMGSTQGLWTKAQRTLEGDANISDGMESLRYSEFIAHITVYIQALERRLSQLEAA
jgi:hypothetical protein